jgi:hypothetical protein
VTEENQPGAEQASAPAEDQQEQPSATVNAALQGEAAYSQDGDDQQDPPADLTSDELLGALGELPEAIEQAITYRSPHLNEARALPEVAKDCEDVTDALFEEGAIQRFKDEDRRTMQVVLTVDGFAKQEV